ncbi:MAG: molybdate ABC transporter substrate-binding protein, partial [Mesorhizobium sp.]
MTGTGFGLKAIAIGGFTAMLMAAVTAARADDKVVVFAAASLKDALD